jgi:hypothetical protein
MEQEGGIGVMAQLNHKSGEAEKQRSKETEKQRSREKQKCGKQKSREAAKPRSRETEIQKTALRILLAAYPRKIHISLNVWSGLYCLSDLPRRIKSLHKFATELLFKY